MARLRCLTLGLALLAVALAGTAVRTEAARAAGSQRLFALDADQGALKQLKGRRNTYRLVLHQVRARATYFTDRPEREVGTVAVRPMLRRLFAGASPAPNAAVNAAAAGRGRLLMGIEISGWHYDPHSRTLTLRVHHLAQGGRTIAHVREDVVLPRSFDDVSIFIDDCCGVRAPGAIYNTFDSEITVAINGGPQIEVPNASEETLLPGSAPIGFNPTFNPRGPQPGVLSPGPNEVEVSVFEHVFPMAVEVPNHLSGTVQLYIFVGQGVDWTLLSNSRWVSSSRTASAAAAARTSSQNESFLLRAPG